MQYEDFDKKIRDAADNHHPAYDEQAWGKMENLLDNHMPVEKEDRRRFIFFLLFFLLLGGAVLLITKPWSSSTSIAVKEQLSKESIINTTDQKADPRNKETGNNLDPGTDVSNQSTKEVASQKVEPVPQHVQSQTSTQSKPNNNVIKSIQKKNTQPHTIFPSEYRTPLSKVAQENNKQEEETLQNVSNTLVIRDDNNKSTIPNKKNDSPVSSNNKKVTPTNTTSDISAVIIDKKSTAPSVIEPATKKEELTQEKKEKKEKPKSVKSNSFFFSLSAGPDVSAAGSEKLGKTKLLAGFGFGYTFKEKLTIRTGFYSGRKIYAASPGEYNPPADFWNYYPYLEKVEADCKVFEIPLSLSYNFGKSSKYNWFASAGLSSYLMKKEVYNYYYKYAPNTPTINSKWTVEDENKHLFSVVTLSGGYQRKINNSVSLLLEPYIKLPLTGVGYGKVKLNSGGVLMTLSIKPFHKNTKEK